MSLTEKDHEEVLGLHYPVAHQFTLPDLLVHSVNVHKAYAVVLQELRMMTVTTTLTPIMVGVSRGPNLWRRA